MTSEAPVFFLPGARGVAPHASVLGTITGEPTRIERLSYPGWRRYSAEGFSIEALLEELAAEITARAPEGPIRLAGISLGGHFAYALALHFQAAGREVEGFCAIDSFMFDSPGATKGWKARALAQAWELIRKRRFAELMAFLRSKFWRALLRLGRLSSLMRKFSSSKKPSGDPEGESLFEEELSLRLLLSPAAAWVASLDREPRQLTVPALLLRTHETARDDEAWRRRCPGMSICQVTGHHHSLLEPENIGSLRDAYLTATREWALVYQPAR